MNSNYNFSDLFDNNIKNNLDYTYSYNINTLNLYLFSKYNRDTIPYENNKLNISIGLDLNNFDIIETENIVKYNIWLEYRWSDYQLK